MLSRLAARHWVTPEEISDEARRGALPVAGWYAPPTFCVAAGASRRLPRAPTSTTQPRPKRVEEKRWEFGRDWYAEWERELGEEATEMMAGKRKRQVSAEFDWWSQKILRMLRIILLLEHLLNLLLHLISFMYSLFSFSHFVPAHHFYPTVLLVFIAF